MPDADAGGARLDGRSYFDPRATAMSSMVSGLNGGMMSGFGGTGDVGVADPTESAMRETVSDALENEAKAAMEQLGKKK
jgi:hypothetical protein